mmetsp:Transcript_2042/g.5409  ORF Transcript_2042/g.5409 Transcript_2042/m.5409 type:complete len:221 (-) Transcript_2042:17-679(-)
MAAADSSTTPGEASGCAATGSSRPPSPEPGRAVGTSPITWWKRTATATTTTTISWWAFRAVSRPPSGSGSSVSPRSTASATTTNTTTISSDRGRRLLTSGTANRGGGDGAVVGAGAAAVAAAAKTRTEGNRIPGSGRIDPRSGIDSQQSCSSGGAAADDDDRRDGRSFRDSPGTYQRTTATNPLIATGKEELQYDSAHYPCGMRKPGREISYFSSYLATE